jgi:hypothetical protein
MRGTRKNIYQFFGESMMSGLNQFVGEMVMSGLMDVNMYT